MLYIAIVLKEKSKKDNTARVSQYSNNNNKIMDT